MEAELLEEFQAIILDHDGSPRHFGSLDAPFTKASCYNPICGDSYEVFVRLADDTIECVGFTGHGCAVSRASLSIMASLVGDMTATEASKLYERLRTALFSDAGLVEGDSLELRALTAVRRAPARVRCALLGWEALMKVLEMGSSD